MASDDVESVVSLSVGKAAEQGLSSGASAGALERGEDHPDVVDAAAYDFPPEQVAVLFRHVHQRQQLFGADVEGGGRLVGETGVVGDVPKYIAETHRPGRVTLACDGDRDLVVCGVADT